MRKIDTNTINGRFREVRVRTGMTQKEFADQLQMTRVAVNSIEIGRFRPTLDVVQRMHKRFKVSYTWMIDGVEEITEKKYIDNMMKLDECKETIEELRKNNEMLRDYNELLKQQYDKTKKP